MDNLTIVMPFLNEGDQVRDTVKSIYASPNSESIKTIAIDDVSGDRQAAQIKESLKEYPNARYIRNDVRIGVDGSRHKGVELAETNSILIIDGHMRFWENRDWTSKILDRIQANPQTIYCCTCLGLGYGADRIERHVGKYHGADLKLLTDQERDRPCRNVLEPKWAMEKPEIEYPIPCVLGANYFFNREWFLKLHGLAYLRSWGTSEPFLSLKSYLAGGDCKINREIEIAHFFRPTAPYVTNVKDLIYNKIYVLKTIFPKEIEDGLMRYIPKDRNYEDAMRMIEADQRLIESEKQYYQSIFTCSVYNYCKRFGIEIPN